MNLTKIIDQFKETGFVAINRGELSNENLIDLASAFGSIYQSKINYKFQDGSSIVKISEVDMFGKGEIAWHKDMMHTLPYFPGTLLYCEIEDRTHTEFCSTILKDSEFTFPDLVSHACFSGRTGLSDKENKLMERMRSNPKLRDKLSLNFSEHLLDQAPIESKFLIENPLTKEICMNYSRATMVNISEDEINAIENFILETGNHWKHSWQKYDVILFDNYRMMHKRGALVENSKRLLKRINFNFNKIL